MCRAAQNSAVPLVHPRPYGPPRAASQPAQLFQPSAPAAAPPALADQSAADAGSGSGADLNTDLKAATAASGASGSGLQPAGMQRPSGKTGRHMHNPYAHLSGATVRSDTTAQDAVAKDSQDSSPAPDALQLWQTAQHAQVSFASPHQDLAATYSSFSHDSALHGGAFGRTNVQGASGCPSDCFDANDHAAAVIPAYTDGDAADPNEMTELQF